MQTEDFRTVHSPESGHGQGSLDKKSMIGMIISVTLEFIIL